MDRHETDEQLAASAVVSLSGWKRDVRMGCDASEDRPNKFQKIGEDDLMPPPPTFTPLSEDVSPPNDLEEKKRTLQPAPFFFYRDFSQVPDDDPLTPLTPPARVPNFPAKMHAILSHPDLVDIVAWMPHGRSWRVLKPREFEVKIIPTYFEHQKFSSFIRQANGWGFRRITQGRDRNSYYHELFLRGLPHLCKKMKRPGVSKKAVADPDHEPDFYKISELYSVPSEAAIDELTLLPSTVIGGPKARMPVHFGALSDYTKLFATKMNTTTDTNNREPKPGNPNKPLILPEAPIVSMSNENQPQSLIDLTDTAKPAPKNLTGTSSDPVLISTQAHQAQPATDTRNSLKERTQQHVMLTDLELLVQRLKTASQEQTSNTNTAERILNQIHQSTERANPASSTSILSALLLNHPASQGSASSLLAASLAASNQQSVAASQAASVLQLALQPSQMGDPASQFAAGFAAATAFNNNHVRSVINHALAASNAAATSAAIQAIYGTPNSNRQQENSRGAHPSNSYPPYGSGGALDPYSSRGFL